MSKKSLSAEIKEGAIKFLKLSGVVIVLVAAYFILIYPIAKKALISKLKPLDVREEMMDYAYSTGAAPSFAPEAKMGIMPPMPGGDSFVVGGAYEQQVIKNANLALNVDSVSSKMTAIQNIAEANGGFTQNASTSEDQKGNLSGYVTVRIPEAKFNETISQIKALAVKVVSEGVSGQDVTQEYTDLMSQLDSLIKVKDQYNKLLEQAESVDEILQVQDRLINTQQQIDYLQGRINYLSNQTSYASIYVSLSEVQKIEVPVDKFDLNETFRLAFQTAVRIFQNFLSFIIVAAFSLIGLVPYLIVVYAVYRLWKYLAKKFTSKKKK